jgi:hypothetical protein
VLAIEGRLRDSHNRALYEIAQISMITRAGGIFREPSSPGRWQNEIIGLYHFAQRSARRFPNLSPRPVGAMQGATAKRPLIRPHGGFSFMGG